MYCCRHPLYKYTTQTTRSPSSACVHFAIRLSALGRNIPFGPVERCPHQTTSFKIRSHIRAESRRVFSKQIRKNISSLSRCSSTLLEWSKKSSSHAYKGSWSSYLSLSPLKQGKTLGRKLVPSPWVTRVSMTLEPEVKKLKEFAILGAALFANRRCRSPAWQSICSQRHPRVPLLCVASAMPWEYIGRQSKVSLN